MNNLERQFTGGYFVGGEYVQYRHLHIMVIDIYKCVWWKYLLNFEWYETLNLLDLIFDVL